METSGLEKAKRWVDLIAGISVILTMGFIALQWNEMRSGSVDTHDLAVASKAQADAAKVQSEQAKAQTEKMSESLTKTDALILRATEQATATSKLAEAAKRQAEAASAALRPWIKIGDVELRPSVGPAKTLTFHWPLTGALMPPMLQVRVPIVNVGHSPAQNVEVFSEVFFGKFRSDKWYEVVTQEQQRFCRSAINRTPSGAAQFVFPSDPLEENLGVGGEIHELDIMHQPDRPASIAASLILCVNYRTAGSVPYQTQARYGLYEDNQVYITVGADMDAGRLRLIREPNSDHAN